MRIVSVEELGILQHAKKAGACFYGFVPQMADVLHEEGLLAIRDGSDTQDTLYVVSLTAKGQEAMDIAQGGAPKIPSGDEFTVTGNLTVDFVDEEALDAYLDGPEKVPPYDAPVHPFYIDKDGDICDANGWLVALTPFGVWADVEHHAQTMLKALNKHPFLTPEQHRQNNITKLQHWMREHGRYSW